MNQADSPKPPSRRARNPLFTVIDRMVTLELGKTLGSILTVLVVIIVSRKFLNILAKAIEGDVAGDTLFELLALKTLAATAILLPPSMFMAILTVIGRMYRDHEMAVLASAGVGAARLYRALSWVAVPVFLLSAYLALVAMPWSEQRAQALMKKDEQSADIRGIKPGRFNEFSSGDTVLYAEDMDGDNIMSNIFVQHRTNNTNEVTVAERGHLKHTSLDEYFVVLNDGRRYQGAPGRVDYIVSEFGEYAVRIPSPEEESAALKREGKTTAELIREWTPRELAELQKRLAVPLGLGFLSVMAVPLARVAPRRGPYGNVFTAFLIYVIYENAQKVTQGMLMTGKIPLWLSFTGIYAVLVFIILGLSIKSLGMRGFLHLFRRSARA